MTRLTEVRCADEMSRVTEVRCADEMSDTGYLVMSINPAHVVWVSDHPERPGRSLIKLTDGALMGEGDRAHVVALLERRDPRR